MKNQTRGESPLSATPCSRRVGRHFWLGWGTCACSLAAFQDWMGKERYMQWINETWAHLSPWIGTIGAVMCLTLHIVGQWKSRHANVDVLARRKNASKTPTD